MYTFSHIAVQCNITISLGFDKCPINCAVAWFSSFSILSLIARAHHWPHDQSHYFTFGKQSQLFSIFWYTNNGQICDVISLPVTAKP
jgi:hypothetical protein